MSLRSSPRSPFLAFVIVAAVLGLVSIAQPIALAQRLRAQVYITQAAVPRSGTERALISFARSHQSRVLNETQEEDLTQRRWIAQMITAFNAPPGDLEYHAIYYDITDNGREFVQDMSMFLNDRSQRTYLNRITLPRPRFRPNRRYEVVITVRHQEAGTGRFETRGELPQHSGMVDFTQPGVQ